jgi:hypothetical protein
MRILYSRPYCAIPDLYAHRNPLGGVSAAPGPYLSRIGSALCFRVKMGLIEKLFWVVALVVIIIHLGLVSALVRSQFS